MAGTSREEEKAATAEEMAAAEEKSDSSDEGEEMEEDVESDSDDSPGSKRMKVEGYIPYLDLLAYYANLNHYLAYQDRSGPNFTDLYDLWSEEPATDRQYIAFYDKLMATPNFFSLVGEQRNVLGEDCQCLRKAQEVADSDDQFRYLDEGPMDCCVQDMRREHALQKELEKLKEYEYCLLDSKYWKNGESASVNLEDYQLGFYLTYFRLADVKKDFESWIFKLGSSRTEDELRKRVEDDHAKRLKICEGYMLTRARYIKKKFEHCRKAGIESIDFELSRREMLREIEIEKTTSLEADS